MQRRTKLMLIAFLVVGYGIIPIASFIDSLLFFDGGQYTIAYVYQNLWEATIFFGGVGAGLYIMQLDQKTRPRNIPMWTDTFPPNVGEHASDEVKA